MELGLQIIPFYEVVLRAMLAGLMGFALGMDRDKKNKPIGQRAYMIVAITTCLLAVMGQELYADFDHTDNFIKLDLGKVVAGVLTGIGFLGAGAIIKRSEQDVIGTTTGASIWASGGFGLMLGFGFYSLYAIGFLSTLAILKFKKPV